MTLRKDTDERGNWTIAYETNDISGGSPRTRNIPRLRMNARREGSLSSARAISCWEKVGQWTIGMRGLGVRLAEDVRDILEVLVIEPNDSQHGRPGEDLLYRCRSDRTWAES